MILVSRDSMEEPNSSDSVAERKKVLEAEVQSLREKLEVLVTAKSNFLVQAEQLRRDLVAQPPLSEEETSALRTSIASRDSIPMLSLTKRTRVDLEVELLSLRKKLDTLEKDVNDASLLVQKFKSQSDRSSIYSNSSGLNISNNNVRGSVYSVSGNSLAIPQWVKEVTEDEVTQAKQNRRNTFNEDPEKMSFRERLSLFL